MKRTDLITFAYGDAYRVYRDEDGRLYFRMSRQWYGTWPEQCIKGTPNKKTYKR